MSKIVRAANAMISNPNKITNVKKGKNEFFFMYNNKYAWSIRYDNEEDIYFLFYYHQKVKIDDLIKLEAMNWQDFSDFITYSSKELGTREAYKTFNEIYTIVKEKLLGIDKVLNDIIEDDEEGPF